MESINANREVRASTNKVWDLVSDVDRDPEFWSGMSSLHNIRKEGNVIERSVVVGLMGHAGLQRIELNPRESIQMTMTKGPIKGSREIRLIPLDEEKTRVDVSWNFQFSGVPGFARPFVRSQLERTTKDALERIARAAEKPSSGSFPSEQAGAGEPVTRAQTSGTSGKGT
jgi:ribosome-associated toxin RatA of RatAB toxin-antitoxin module